MKRNKLALTSLALLGVVGLALAGCSGGGGDSGDNGSADASAIITTNGSEPENPLIPTSTNETGGGKILDAIFAGLVSYEANGAPVNDMAEEITVDDPQNLTVKIKQGQTFTNGEEVTADNFIKAWNYGALASNEQYNSYFFEDIEGFSYDADSELTGLKQVDDYTFTIALNKPASDFALRLGYSAYYPLPDVAFDDLDAFGENPVGNGPYKLASEGAWQHNVQIDLVKNEDYQGVRQAQNGGLTISFYASQDAAYAALQGGQLDVLDAVPPSALATFEADLGERAVNQPAAVFQSFTIPARLEHFSGEEGKLRRAAISHAINREEITSTIFQGTRTPATDFTSPVIDGWSDSLEGSDVLQFDVDTAKELWAQADAISPWTGSFQIAYNADGGHDQWVDAISNQLATNLGIDASGAPYPTFAELRAQVNNRTISTPFRSGWQADYPGLYNFLGPLYATNAGSNDGDYSNPEFDRLLAEGISSTDLAQANEYFGQAQTVLFEDLPAIPLWYSNVTGGYAETVQNVEFGWNSVPLFHEITKVG
ncbi:MULTISPECIES: ABC transporter substrate-binding protein [Microbacterium]|uniref:peptide ABC transporter substrate-binding protein n=1 Tax=Microbacterium TaxID=33882 RepID=UPI002783FEC5|nr:MULTISPECIES: ABC transporter substrate-binding protein [Microbacterium]MDQ1083790.1 oligopeptide transport system substrate-binding protein [Microbacterium sp. SORGH_AS_0344]MDQ1170932.1 oligopeptide transport system substrate-binding protein [Microbacterium proteolyticum]